MGKQINRHGLSRRVPKGIQRVIRQEAGFGCVRCGLAIYQYEHVDPEFADAKTHDPAAMTLLCANCNQKKNNGQLSLETVKAAKANPKCKQKGFASDFFDIGSYIARLTFCGNFHEFPEMAFVIAGKPLFRFDLPEVDGGPVRLNCEFSSADGESLFSVEDNEFIVGAENFDVEVAGPVLTIRHKARDIALRMSVHPPSVIIVDKIDLFHCGHRILGDKNGFETIGAHGSTGRRQGNLMLGGAGGIAYFDNQEQEMEANRKLLQRGRAKARSEQPRKIPWAVLRNYGRE